MRRVTFSSGHRYWRKRLSDHENREIFGSWASPYNHGHNYFLEVTIEGDVDEATNMVINIKRLDDLLKKSVLAVYDLKSINDEVNGFEEVSPTLENILLDIKKRISDEQLQVRMETGTGESATAELVTMKLEETPTLWAEWKKEKMTITRSYEFAAAHRLHVSSMSDEENQQLFGKCNNPEGHGHNYILEVSVSGEINPLTGMMVDIQALDNQVQTLIVNRYDHKNLDRDIPEFSNRTTTTEIVTQEIFSRLEEALPAKLTKVKLYETARNAFEVEAID